MLYRALSKARVLNGSVPLIDSPADAVVCYDIANLLIGIDGQSGNQYPLNWNLALRRHYFFDKHYIDRHRFKSAIMPIGRLLRDFARSDFDSSRSCRTIHLPLASFDFGLCLARTYIHDGCTATCCRTDQIKNTFAFFARGAILTATHQNIQRTLSFSSIGVTENLGTVPEFEYVFCDGLIWERLGDSPWVCTRVLLWICLLNAASSRSQAKLAQPHYE